LQKAECDFAENEVPQMMASALTRLSDASSERPGDKSRRIAAVSSCRFDLNHSSSVEDVRRSCPPANRVRMFQVFRCVADTLSGQADVPPEQ